MIRRRLVEGRADPALRLPSVALFAVCIKALNDTIARHAQRRLYVEPTSQQRARWRAISAAARLSRACATSAEHSARTRRQRDLVREAEAALRDPGVYAMTMETITPERAEEYLACNRGNRNIVQSHVAAHGPRHQQRPVDVQRPADLFFALRAVAERPAPAFRGAGGRPADRSHGDARASGGGVCTPTTSRPKKLRRRRTVRGFRRQGADLGHRGVAVAAGTRPGQPNAAHRVRNARRYQRRTRS